MKKYFLFSVMVLMTLCVGFTSCSKDDEDDGGISLDTAIVDITINGEKMPTDESSNLLSYGLYTIPSNLMSINIMFKQSYAPVSYLFVNFKINDLNSIKVGDDITKYSNFDFTVFKEMMSTTKFNSGTITVTQFDSKNKVLSLEFKDVSTTNTSGYGSNQKKENFTINGKVSLPMDVQ